MAETETDTKPGEMKSQTTGKIYPVIAEGLGKILLDNYRWRKKQKTSLLGETLQIPFVIS